MATESEQLRKLLTECMEQRAATQGVLEALVHEWDDLDQAERKKRAIDALTKAREGLTGS